MDRVQIACIGSSSLYGVGGTKGGWPDLFKSSLHQKQYGPDGIGEVHEIYNLGIPGATIEDFLDRIEIDLEAMHKPGRKLITVVQLGGNNTKAVDEPDNYVTTPEEFGKVVGEMLDKVLVLSDSVIWIGMNMMDESKVMPIEKDKELGKKVFFPNKRKFEFDKIAKSICDSKGVTYISLIDKQQGLDWMQSYQYQDGIHPNDKGYEWMYEQIAPHIYKLIEN